MEYQHSGPLPGSLILDFRTGFENKMFSSASSSSEYVVSSQTVVPIEYDTFDRKAQFFLYTRPIEDVVLGHADHVELKHWTLFTLFSDESVRALEGFQAADGKLMPHFLKVSPLSCKGEKYYKLIAMETSPSKLREVTVNNILNGTPYNARENNCQNWVKEAAKAISPNLATALRNYKTNGELSFITSAAQCCWASSRSSSAVVKKLYEISFSDSTDIEKHKLQ